MKRIKQIIAVYLAVIMCIFPSGSTVFASDMSPNTQEQKFQDGIEVEGNDSMGKMLASAISSEQSSSGQNSSANSITGLKIEGNTATVNVRSQEASDLVVAVYNELHIQMLASGKTSVQSGESVVQVKISGKMPQYFIATAFLLDKKTHEALCDAYTTELYTKALQDLKNSTIKDYDEKQVVQLDKKSETTNFAVYKDDTIAFNETNSNVRITDKGNGLYTIQNATDEIIKMQQGDTVAYQYNDGTMLLLKAADISVKGKTVTIREETDSDLNDYFDYVKIEADSSTGDCSVDNSNLEKGITPLNDYGYEDDIEEFSAKEAKAGTSVNINRGVSYGITQEVEKVKIKGSFTLNYGIGLEYYVSHKYKHLSLKFDYSVTTKISLSGKLKIKEIPVGRISISPVPCVNIGFTPSFVIEASGELTWSGTMKGKVGGNYDSNSGFSTSSGFPSCNSALKLEGVLFVGFKATPYVAFISEKLDKASIDISAGVEVSARRQFFDTGEDVLHDCNLCLSGDLKAKASVDMSVKLVKLLGEKKKTLLSGSIKLADFYYSSDYNELGWTNCPHICYPVKVTVKDNTENEVKGTSVLTVTDKKTGKQVKIRTKDLTSDSVNAADSQKIKIYLPNGEYTIKAVLGSREGEQDFTVCNRGTEALIKLSSNVNVDKNITWWIENNDTLYIKGLGDMPDYEMKHSEYLDEEMATTAPWNPENIRNVKIKKIIIEEGITSIGNRAFASMNYLEKIVIPKTVSSIGKSGFFNCYNLTEIEIPQNVTEIKSGAFEGCAKLKNIKLPEKITRLTSALFVYCNNLETIELSKNITEIENDAFTGCVRLKSIKLPEKITTIGDSVFSDCTNLKTIEIPKNVKSIGRGFFQGDTIYFRGSKPELNSNMFYGSKNMTAYYPANDSTWNGIKSQSFGGTNITWIAYNPSSATSLECFDAEEVTEIEMNQEIPDSASAVELSNADTEENINWWIEDNNILHIEGNGTMSDYSMQVPAPWVEENKKEEVEIRKAVIEKGITGIGAYAFAGLDSLEEVRVSETVTSLGNNLFTSDHAQNMYFAGNKPEFSQDAFAGTTDLTVYYQENDDTWSNIGTETFGGTVVRWMPHGSGETPTISDVPDEEKTTGENNDADGELTEETDSEETDFSAEDLIPSDETELETEIESVPENNSETDNEISNEINSETDNTAGEMIQESEEQEAFSDQPNEEQVTEFEAPVSYSQENTEDQAGNMMFSERVPYSSQVFMVLKSDTAEDILLSSNLLYIEQKNADASGVVSFCYILKENYPNPVTKIYGRQIKDINKMKITLSATVCEYSGSAKKPSVKIVDGNYILKNGTDYALSYLRNINVGTAIVKITGKGKYTGTRSVKFTIRQAAPKLQFKNKTVTRKYGSGTFTNPFKVKKTDGKLTYSSSNPKVARVDKNKGKITIVGVGKVVIKVQAKAGKNYKAGKASYTLNITRGTNMIKVTKVVKGKSTRTKVLYIKASAKGGAKLTYKSNSKYVKVNSKGKVTISPQFTGKAVITIRSAKTSKYNSAVRKMTITVKKKARK